MVVAPDNQGGHHHYPYQGVLSLTLDKSTGNLIPRQEKQSKETIMSTYGHGYDYHPETNEFPPQEANSYSYQAPYSDTYHDQDFAPVSPHPEYRMETPESGEKAKRLKKVGKWVMVLSVLGLMTSLSEFLLMITFITGIVFYVRGNKTLKKWKKQETIRMAHFLRGVPPEQFY